MSERKTIQLPVIFDAASRRKSRELGLRLTTTLEISNADFAEIDKYVGMPGYFLFSMNQFTDADIPTEDAPTDLKKPSQRLRGALFRLWEQEGQDEDFDSFYRAKMNGLITFVQNKLDD